MEQLTMINMNLTKNYRLMVSHDAAHCEGGKQCKQVKEMPEPVDTV